MQSRLKLVQLTHVINPSRFYCRDLSKSEVEKAQIYEIEAELQLVAEKQRESQDLLPEIHTYKKNDVSIGIFNESQNHHHFES